jgi:hypothetical protein
MLFSTKRAARCAWSGAALLFLASSAASGAVVPLSSASGTYAQAGFDVSSTIDGVTTGGNGWAVDGGQFAPQTAIFTTAAPLSASQLVFEMAQTSPYAAHNINQFRISVTNAASPSEASTWTPLNITNGAAHADLYKMSDFRVLARNNAINEPYLLRSASPFNGVTGFRLEVLPYDYDANDALPASIGRAGNGNFVLSEFIVRDSAAGLLQNIALGQPTIQSSDGYGLTGAQGVDGIIGGGNITHTNDGDLTPFWEVDLEQNSLIDSVTVYNRDNCCPERLYNITVEVRNAADAVVFTSTVFNPTAAGGTPTDPGASFNIDLPGTGVNGSKVRVIKNANAGVEWMSLSEVQVNVAANLTALASLGDFNSDSVINLSDFDILRNNFHEGTTYAQGDFNFDGTVDLVDFVGFSEAYKFANPGSPLPNSVPEPATWALVGVGTLFLGWVRRRRPTG